MIIVAAKKNNQVYFGTIPKISNLIGVNQITIHRWIKSGLTIVFKNDYEIYLKTERI